MPTPTSPTPTSPTPTSPNLTPTLKARIHLTRSGSTRILCCHGDLDERAVGRLRAELDEILRAGATDLLVDTRAVTWAGSAALGVLTAAERRARADGRALTLANPPDHLVRSLRTTGLHRVLHVTSRATPPRRCHRA